MVKKKKSSTFSSLYKRWLILNADHASYVFIELDKTIKLWKVSERDKRAEGYNLKEDSGLLRDPSSIRALRVPVLRPMELMVEASKLLF